MTNSCLLWALCPHCTKQKTAAPMLLLLLPACLLICALPCRAQGGEQKVVLPCGVRLLLTPPQQSPYIALCLFVHTSPPASAQQNAVAEVVSRAVFYGGSDWLAGYSELALQQVGGELQILRTPHFTEFTLLTVPSKLNDAAELLCEATMHAGFSGQALQKSVQSIEQYRRQRRQSSYREAKRLLLNAVQPFPPPAAAQLRQVTSQQARLYYLHCYTPANIVVSAAGSYQPSALITAFQAYYDGFHRTSVSPAAALDSEFSTSPARRLHASLPGSAAYALLALPAPEVYSPNYAAYTVLTALLGEGHASRMFLNLRNKLALGYQARIEWRPERSEPAIALLQWNGAQPPGSRMQMLRKEVESILHRPPTQAEMKRAEGIAAGNFLRQHERLQERAFFAGWYETMGLPPAFDQRFPALLHAVTAAEVVQQAQKYFQHLTSLLALPASAEN